MTYAGKTRSGKCKTKGVWQEGKAGQTKVMYCHYYPPYILACDKKEAKEKCSYCNKPDCKDDAKVKGDCQKRGKSMLCIQDPKEMPPVKACANKTEKEECMYPSLPDRPATCLKAYGRDYFTCRVLPTSVIACKGKEELASCSYKSGKHERQGYCSNSTNYAALYCSRKKRPTPETDDPATKPKPTTPPGNPTEAPEFMACKRRPNTASCHYRNKHGHRIVGRCGPSESKKLMCHMQPAMKACVDKDGMSKCSYEHGNSNRSGWCFPSGPSLHCRQPSTSEKSCLNEKEDEKCSMTHAGKTRSGKCKAKVV